MARAPIRPLATSAPRTTETHQRRAPPPDRCGTGGFLPSKTAMFAEPASCVTID
jgi:hypothetical protein